MEAVFQSGDFIVRASGRDETGRIREVDLDMEIAAMTQQLAYSCRICTKKCPGRHPAAPHLRISAPMLSLVVGALSFSAPPSLTRRDMLASMGAAGAVAAVKFPAFAYEGNQDGKSVTDDGAACECAAR